MSQLQAVIKDYLESLGKGAAKQFSVSPQKIAAWKRKPETAPFNVIELAGIWAAQDTHPSPPVIDPSDLEHAERHDWGEPNNNPRLVQVEYEQHGPALHPEPEVPAYVNAGYEPEQSVWDHVKNHQEKLYELNDRLKRNEDGIQRILALLQGGAQQQQLQRSPTATTQRIEPQMGPNGELPAFVSSGPQQAATDNLTRPSRYAGQPMTEADLDRIDPNRHKPAVDPAVARAAWMRPKLYGQDRRR